MISTKGESVLRQDDVAATIPREDIIVLYANAYPKFAQNFNQHQGTEIVNMRDSLSNLENRAKQSISPTGAVGMTLDSDEIIPLDRRFKIMINEGFFIVF